MCNDSSPTSTDPPPTNGSPPMSHIPPPLLATSPPNANLSSHSSSSPSTSPLDSSLNSPPDSLSMFSKVTPIIALKLTAWCMHFFMSGVTYAGRALCQQAAPYVNHNMLQAVFFPIFLFRFMCRKRYRFMIHDIAGIVPVDSDHNDIAPTYNLKSLRDDVEATCRKTQRAAFMLFILCVAVYCFGHAIQDSLGYQLLILVAVLFCVEGFLFSYSLKAFVQSVNSSAIDRWTFRQIRTACVLMASPRGFRWLYLIFVYLGVVFSPSNGIFASTVPSPDFEISGGEPLPHGNIKFILVATAAMGVFAFIQFATLQFLLDDLLYPQVVKTQYASKPRLPSPEASQPHIRQRAGLGIQATGSAGDDI